MVNKQVAITKLEGRIAALMQAHVNQADEPALKKWRRDTEVALEHVFGSGSRHLTEFREIRFTPAAFSSHNADAAFARALELGLETANVLLRSMIEEVGEYWPDGEMDSGSVVASAPAASDRVFIVHGHGDAAREAAARLITRLGLAPVILHEQPSKGRTIIEKFVEYADVGFALVLMTADDLGGPKSADASVFRPRARQNVVLELGFFLGRLGRDRVCALYEDGVELPSDYDGVVFIPLDPSGAWQLMVGRELRAAGMDADLNQLTK